MERWKDLLKQAQDCAAKAQAIAAKGSGPNGALTPQEMRRYEAERDRALARKAESDTAKKAAEDPATRRKEAADAGLFKWMTGSEAENERAYAQGVLEDYRKINDPSEDDQAQAKHAREVLAKTGGAGMIPSQWTEDVLARMTKAAAGVGMKAVTVGQSIGVPSAVEIAPLPETPRRLLDLIIKEPLDSHTWDYLRQTTRTDRAAVVPDGQLKPESDYEFTPVEDHARVIAHRTAPFPKRYLADYKQLGGVLETQMRAGVLTALEAQIIAGDGVGENLPGILSTTGVRAIPFATDVYRTLRLARAGLEDDGVPVTAWAFNPLDAANLELARENTDGSGAFLMDSSVYDVIFGAGVARIASPSVPAGQALVGDWSQLTVKVRENEMVLAFEQAPAPAGDGTLIATAARNQVWLLGEGRFGLEFRQPGSMAVVDLTA